MADELSVRATPVEAEGTTALEIGIMATTDDHADGLLAEAQLPPRVYHYTSTAGLLGIVGGSALWATDLRYLNDTSELRFGLRQVLKSMELIAQTPRRQSVLDRMAALYKVDQWIDLGPRKSTELDVALDRLDPLIDAVVGDLGPETVIGVACFCTNGDLLSQWRGYGAGGYSIGFDAHALRGIVHSRYLPLTSVVYGRIRSTKNARPLADRVERLLTYDSSSRRAQLRQEVTLPLLRLAAQIKDESFAEEAELRLGDSASTNGSSDQLRFREGPLGATPYLNLALHDSGGRAPVRHVIVAPGLDAELRREAVCALLSAKGYKVGGRGGVEVSASTIPFRS